VKFVAEYRQFAEEYRKLLGKVASPEDRDALELMARAWERISKEREDRLNSVGREPETQPCEYRGPLYNGCAMDKTIARLNIENYRKKLAIELDETKRQTFMHLLTEERAKLAALDLPEKERRSP
jgi:hypothetical protein